MKCPTCESERINLRVVCGAINQQACKMCGTMYTIREGEVIDSDIPDYMRWRNAEREPSVSETEIIATSKLAGSGEYCTDIAWYNVHSSNFERDTYVGVAIEWWRPLGPMPEKGEESGKKNEYC